MNRETHRHEITKRRVLYQMPDIDVVATLPDLEYQITHQGVLTMDIYYPAQIQRREQVPAVIFALGYPDSGFQKMLGCKQKEMESFISWARLVAASGLVAITYETEEPTADLPKLLQHVRQNAASLGIKGDAIGVWACSGHVPNTLSVLMRKEACLGCAVLCYGYMLDGEGTTWVAEAARQYGFTNPCAGKSVKDLPRNMPLFIARAGKDEMPHLNEVLDSFLHRALGSNLPVTFVNHAEAPHAFDLFHESEDTREIIRRILSFLRFHLLK